MLEETARVVSITDHQIWVVGTSNSACAACVQNTSCGTATLNQTLKKKPVQVDSELALKVGDSVLVAIDETALLRAAFLMYLLPTLILLIGAGVADSLLTHVQYKEVWIAVSAVLSLALGLCLIRHIKSNYSPKPIVLKVIT
jgi:sigma-E factor negative regulatory protein RseC